MRVQRPRAVVAHGSGSSPDFVRRAFGPALDDAGFALVTVDERSGDVSVVLAALRSAVESTSAALVGGVSLGAHAAAMLAAERGDLAGVLLVLPAWTGRPGAVARLSDAAADEVERQGLAAAVTRVADQGWVGAELAAAWPGYGQAGLVRALRATALSAGPDDATLAAISAPVGLVGLRDDPFHPVEVARRWAGLVPRSALEELGGDAPGADRGVLGRAAVRAWRRACGDRVSGPR